MFGWKDIGKKDAKPQATAAPVPRPVPTPVPVEDPTRVMLPPPTKPFIDVQKAIEAVDNAIDLAFSKKKKIPQPHECGGCGGIVWA